MKHSENQRCLFFAKHILKSLSLCHCCMFINSILVLFVRKKIRIKVGSFRLSLEADFDHGNKGPLWVLFGFDFLGA